MFRLCPLEDNLELGMYLVASTYHVLPEFTALWPDQPADWHDVIHPLGAHLGGPRSDVVLRKITFIAC